VIKVIVTSCHIPGKTEQAKSSIPDTSEVFNALVWWGVEKYRFPYLSVAAKLFNVQAQNLKDIFRQQEKSLERTEQDCTAARLKCRYWWLKA